jgi:hypothetical protein
MSFISERPWGTHCKVRLLECASELPKLIVLTNYWQQTDAVKFQKGFIVQITARLWYVNIKTKSKAIPIPGLGGL